jgi:hypothetical protein
MEIKLVLVRTEDAIFGVLPIGFFAQLTISLILFFFELVKMHVNEIHPASM